MSSRSISLSLPCDNDSELSSSMNEDVPEVIEGEFIPYDENLEPVAIEEEVAAWPQLYITSAVRDICTFAVLCSVTRPFLTLHSCLLRALRVVL